MNLLYVSSGKKTLSDLNPSIVSAFRELENDLEGFSVETFFTEKEPIQSLMEKTKKFKPSIIVVFGHDAHPITETLKTFGVPIGLWVVNDPYSLSNYEQKVKYYNFIITQESSCLLFYRKKRDTPSIHCPLAVNINNYYPMETSYEYDICFVGNAWPGRVGFFNSLIPSLHGKKIIIIGNGWYKLKHYQEIKSHFRLEIMEPLEVTRYYNRSKIVLNVHRDNNDVNRNPENIPAYTPNNRTFDIGACKAFQLITHRRDLKKYYDLNKEIVSYNNLKDLIQKINYYLTNEQLRNEIAEQAYKRTLLDHTYYVRLRGLIKKLDTQILKQNNKEVSK
ncbi:MAG: glycosyltransferase [Halanaerobiales bacterium]|nr:glycosyltransferase [Halanaerobiales bacterium]